ncbi:MAG: tetratricopeptide repeat protein [Thermoplasmata archaeon]|nr:MAG: tetratricopeptide repeat protein [Thermoplasmata archaeon]
MAQVQPTDERRPEIDIYKTALMQAWSDGTITEEEESMLASLRESLEITAEEHDRLLNEIRERERDPALIAYKLTLEQVLADGEITPKEQAILNALQEKLNITELEHKQIEEEIRYKLGLPEDGLDYGVTGLDRTKSVEVDENDAHYWNHLGERIWAESSQTDSDAERAIECFDKAIALEPLNYLAWANKGFILKQVNRTEDALMCYDRAIMLKPEYPNAWYNKGVLLGSKGNLNEAKECFDKVLEIDPGHSLALKHKKILEDLLARRQSTIVRVRKVRQK